MIDPRITSFVDANKDSIVDLLCRLLAIDTTNPPGNEHLAAAVMIDMLKEHGIECETLEKEPGRTNVVARIGSGTPRTLIACHFDVVPAGDGWDSDPFVPLIRDGRIYGRGSSDNKGQLAAMLGIAPLLKQCESELLGEVILIGAADEERGSGLGLEWMADEGMLEAEFAIIPDVDHAMREIMVAEKGALFLKITSFGRQAHGSAPSDGVNAIVNMIDLLNEIRKLDFTRHTHPIMSSPTMNIGMINGGSAPNIVAGKCEAQVDFRFLPTQSAPEIEAAIRAAAQQIEQSCEGAKFSFETLMQVDPFEIDSSNPLVQRLQSKAHEILGWKPTFSGMSGSTVSKPLVRCGIASVGFGPGDENQAHIANESISVEDLLSFAKILANFLIR